MMKLTTPTYGEEPTGKGRRINFLPDCEIAPVQKGHNVMLLNIYKRMQAIDAPDLKEELLRLKKLLKSAKSQPEGSSYNHWAVHPWLKEYEEQIIIKKDSLIKELENKIKKLEKKEEWLKLTYNASAKLFKLEPLIDEKNVDIELLSKCRDNIVEAIGLLNERLMVIDSFNIDGKEYPYDKIIRFAHDLLDEVNRKLSEFESKSGSKMNDSSTLS